MPKVQDKPSTAVVPYPAPVWKPQPGESKKVRDAADAAATR